MVPLSGHGPSGCRAFRPPATFLLFQRLPCWTLPFFPFAFRLPFPRPQHKVYRPGCRLFHELCNRRRMAEKSRVLPVPYSPRPRPVPYPLPAAFQIYFTRVLCQHRFPKPRALLPAMVFHAPRERFLRHPFAVPESVKRYPLFPSASFPHGCVCLPPHKLEQLRSLFPRRLSGKRLPLFSVFISPPLGVISSAYSALFVYKR
jgi:hypothetical protein